MLMCILLETNDSLPKCLMRENVFEILCLLFKNFQKMLIAN